MPTRDRVFPAGCVFWMALIGFGLTCLAFFGIRALNQVLGGSPSTWIKTLTSETQVQQPTFGRNRRGSVVIGQKTYFLEIVDTDATRAQGLSDRTGLDPNTGMLFIFETPDRYTFWMKDMLFPIDMVFLKDGQVVNIANNVPPPATPDEAPAVVQPLQAFNQTLELPAGDADKLGLKIGQKLVLPE